MSRIPYLLAAVALILAGPSLAAADAREEANKNVILHVHAVRTPGERGSAIVDIFRMEDGKMVEHWANNNGMF